MQTAIVTDTNVFVHDPEAVDFLRNNGQILSVPWVVILELDKLKDRPDIGLDAREALARIEDLRMGGEETLKIIRNPSFRSLADLDKKNPDHQIIATAKTLDDVKSKKREFGYENVELLSRDRPVRVLAREVGLIARNYYREKIVPTQKHSIPEINVAFEEIDKHHLIFPCSERSIEENQGAVCYSDFNHRFNNPQPWGKHFAAIRKGEHFRIIPPGIGAVGLGPFMLNNGNGKSKPEEKNWAQYIALDQLLDPSIELVFLQGGAGTGKTLLAVASAIEQRKLYHQIIITRPMIHLEDEDRMGFLPGSEEQKMSPWLRPINQALSFLRNLEGTGNNELIEKLVQTKKIDFESLDYIRGTTYYKTLLIIDEAQNLTPHQVKTIITRAGMHTKLVFTGDLGQIDRRRRIDDKSSGLAYGINAMRNNPLVGVATFRETVRSPLVKLAEERM